MWRFVEGQDRTHVTLIPACLDDFIAEDNLVRVIDAFVQQLDLSAQGFKGTMPASTGRPAYVPAVLLKIYIYGYLHGVQSSRRLERECQRNVELMWLTGRLARDFKTIAKFRRDNLAGIRNVFRKFVSICRQLKLLSQGVVAVDGSKLKAVNNRDRNFTPHKLASACSKSKRASHATWMHWTPRHAAVGSASQDHQAARQVGQATQANAALWGLEID